MRSGSILMLFGVAVCAAAGAFGQQDSVPAVMFRSAHLDQCYVQDNQLMQDLYVEAEPAPDAVITLETYLFFSETDSIKALTSTSSFTFRKGLNKINLNLMKTDVRIHPVFRKIVMQTNLLPVATYRTALHIQYGSGSFNRSFIHQQDSILHIQSPVIKGLGNLLQPAPGLSGALKKGSEAMDKASTVLTRRGNRMDRYFKKKSLLVQHHTDGNKEVIDLYAENWFMGRYTLDGNTPIAAQLKSQQDAFDHNPASLARSDLGNSQSLLSQFRELKKDSREHTDLSGELSFAANFSNDQEPGSGQDNNYYEGRGTLEFPIFDIPVSLSGYYTTQDKNREAKSSYVHFRYDAEKAKEQLLRLVGSYNRKYEQAVTQGSSMEMIYGQFIGEMQQQKDKALAGLKQQADLSGIDMNALTEDQLKQAVLRKGKKRTDKLQDSLRDKISEQGGALNGKVQAVQEAEEKAEQAYAKALEQYARVVELERKIRKYKDLLDQYKNTSYYDSLMAYSKSRELQALEGASYKDIAKKASALLPESKTKNLITGLTNFDAGIFPKYVSDYTMSGQLLKGVDVGYDIGFAQIGGSYGKTEYIGRDGHVEGYKTYSARVRSRQVLKQTLGFVYYGYSPGSKMLSDHSFFKDVSLSLPSFRNPVHIFSAVYNGEVSAFVHLSGEYALTTKPGQSKEAASGTANADRSAYQFRLEGNIPAQNLTLEAAYEHAGKAFENNTLPVLMAGTDRFRISGTGDLFRSFLSLGVAYNYLVQNSLSSRGNNARWGFHLATHSKRYPSVSLSYKPFSTFRSFDDTLAVAQKPIQGEVWSGKLNYQIKKKDRAIRFTLLYNRNSSTMDTLRYASTLLQFNTIYSHKATLLSLNLGSTSLQTDLIATAYPAFNSSRFANISASGAITPQTQLSGGTDIALAGGALGRYGFFLGAGYTFKRIPVMIRTNFRYTQFKPAELTGWKQLYSGGFELAWRFKMKVFDN